MSKAPTYWKKARTYLSKNYVNINLKTLNSKITSSTKEYTNNIIKHLQNNESCKNSKNWGT